MVREPSDDAAIDVLQRHFETRGWQATEPTGRRWVDHTLECGGALLRVRFLPGIHRLVLDVRFSHRGARLGVWFDEANPDPVLTVIDEHCAGLDEGRWSPFVSALLAVSPKVMSIEGVDGEHRRRLTTAADAVTALRTPEDLPPWN